MKPVGWVDEASDRDVVEAIRLFSMHVDKASKAVRLLSEAVRNKLDPLTAPWAELVEDGS